MKYPPSFLDDIRARLPVSEVVGARVKLKKQGREWRGLSPFNAEKTPSFYVNDQKGFYHDFSSGKHGDAFSFVMETEGLSFPEAVERLAGLAGVPMPVETPEQAVRERERAGLEEVLEKAAAFFEAQLQARIGAKARGALADRGLPPSLWPQFRIGYAPADRFALRDHLADAGARVETMIEAGLLIHGEDIAVPYDRFRDRIMFPICDRAGRVIAFGGRAMDKDAPAKYLNSPETPLFHKGSCLYNHHNARKAAPEKGTVIAVEGYVDVISMSAAGFPHVVAPLGTALTPDQCALLWRMAPDPILCFDGDKAGVKAAWRAIDTVLPLIGPDKSLRFALLPEGQDPDDLARSGGASAVMEVLASARPLADMLWAREAGSGPLDTPERRAALERRLKTLLRDIKDDTIRHYYLQDMDQRLASLFGLAQQVKRTSHGPGQRRAPGQSFQAGRNGYRPGARQNGYFQSPSSLDQAPVPSSSLTGSALFARGRVGFSPREALILLICVNHPDLLMRHGEELAQLDLAHPDVRSLRDWLIGISNDPGLAIMQEPSELRARLEADGLDAIFQKIIDCAPAHLLWCVQADAAEADAEEVLHQALVLHRRAGVLHKELKLAETALANEADELSLMRLRDILSQLAAMEGTEASIEGFGLQSGRQNRIV